MDAPLTMALDNNGELSKCYVIVGRAESQKAGLENLTLASDYNKKYPKDEDHCWDGGIYRKCRKLLGNAG